MSAIQSAPIGDLLAGYRIQGLIGRGGMSEVYRAEHVTLERAVALKVLDPKLAHSDGFRERFLRESRLASSLDHPNIVQIFEAGEAGGYLYIAMRLVDGGDLRSLITERGALDVDLVLRVVSATARGLDAAHRSGLIHRDVKPANILIARADETKREHVYLSDFGLTKRIGAQSRYTETGHLVGSAHYMAPEQIEGEQITTRADVYALGCVLFEMVTGKVPYDRDSDLAVLWAHVNSDVPSVRAARSELPAALDDVIARALSKRPDDRYESCGDLASDTRRALRGRPARASTRRQASAARAATLAGGRAVPVPRSPLSAAARTIRSIAVAALVLSVGGSLALTVGRATGLLGPQERVVIQGSAPDEPEEPAGGRGKAGIEPTRRDSVLRQRSQSDASQPSAEVQRPAVDTNIAPDRGGAALPTDPREVATGVRDVVAERTITERYSPVSLAQSGWDDCVAGDAVGCVDFTSRSTERFVTIEIADDNAQHVHAWVRQDTDGDLEPDGEWAEICDRTEWPVRIRSGAVVNVMLVTGDCRRGGQSTPTSGTVKVTFHTEI